MLLLRILIGSFNYYNAIISLIENNWSTLGEEKYLKQVGEAKH